MNYLSSDTERGFRRMKLDEQQEGKTRELEEFRVNDNSRG